MNPYHDSDTGKFTSGMRVQMPDGSLGALVNDGKVTKIVTFAGKGTNKSIHVAEHLAKRFKNKPEDWKKCRGDGYVTNQIGITRHCELHWFYSKKSQIYALKVKRYLDES